MSHARDERSALVASLRDAGPDAPTLCAGWTTRDLAAHLDEPRDRHRGRLLVVRVVRLVRLVLAAQRALS